MPTIRAAVRAYIQVTVIIPAEQREKFYQHLYDPFRKRFLDRVPGAVSKNLLLRTEDIQILGGFDTLENARRYLSSDLFRHLCDRLAEENASEPITTLYQVHD